jgi:hypothetical protein
VHEYIYIYLVSVVVINSIDLLAVLACFWCVQWMTAGRGVVHAEMPGGEGVHRGISIWINLYSKEKMYVLLHRRHLLALCLEFC